MIPPRFLTIEGNIGAGKTTLASRLADDLQAYLLLEQFIDNPFLAKFYKHPDRYAFSTETAFLAERFRQFHDEFLHMDPKKQSVISDYSFYKSLIFARQTLDKDEFDLFQNLFGIINQRLPQSHLFVYLHTPVATLLKNIAKRGRSFEKNIQADYLQKIENGYMNFMENASGLRCLLIHTENTDFVKNPETYQHLKEIISADYRYGITEITLA